MLRRLLPVVVLGLFVSCGGSSSAAPTPLNVPFSVTDLIVGTGTTVTVGTAVEFTYIGYLYSTTAANNQGPEFDDSSISGPYVAVVGAGQMIKGLEQGLVGMKVGGQRQIVIPPDLGYGASASQTIPANSTLLFIVNLIQAQPPTTSGESTPR